MTKAGRPTFNIKPDRLRALRKQAGMTQKALAEPVFSVATLKSVVSDPRTPTNTYQRIERTGKTSEKAARRIAEVLAQALKQDPDKTFAALCGGQPEPPPNRIDEIEKQLRAQLEGGVNASLQQARQRHNDADNPIRELATDISTRLEIAQLEQRSDELKQLAALTGWTADELQRPTSQQGYWLFNTKTYGHSDTRVVLGVSEVLYQIKTEGGKCLGDWSESDALVELSEDAPWLRVLLQHPSHPWRSQEFSFVRCAPSATGLQWVKPTEWDRWTIDGEFTSGLKDWAFQHANFVKGSKSEDVWPRDLGCLRLLVRQRVKPENPESAEESDRWKNIAVHRGWLGEEKAFQDERRDSFRALGQEHFVVTNWLASGLWDDVLAPLLSPVPADWWEIEALESVIRVRTKTLLPIHETPRYALEPRGKTYVIRLVEETEPGELRRAPWRLKDVQALAERLQNNLKACQEQVAIGPQRPRWITAA